MIFINTETNEYPVMEGYIRQQNPNVSFPRIFTGMPPFEPVFDSELPVFDADTQELKEGHPSLIDGKYVRTWEIVQLSQEEILAKKEKNIQNRKELLFSRVQNRLDRFASTRNYDGILAACSYATSAHEKFKQEALYCIQARDATWLKFYEILGEMESGVRSSLLSIGDIEAELPTLSWPE